MVRTVVMLSRAFDDSSIHVVRAMEQRGTYCVVMLSRAFDDSSLPKMGYRMNGTSVVMLSRAFDDSSQNKFATNAAREKKS